MPPTELASAFQRVHQGEQSLPLEATYEVLRDAAPKLAVTAKERRGRLGGVLLGILPLSGLIAAITALLWREYWSQISVRVVDLGVDPTTRVTNVFVNLLGLLGVFGPLLFVDGWRQGIGAWAEEKTSLAGAVDKVRGFQIGGLPLGRLIFNRVTAWLVMALSILSATVLLWRYASLIVTMFLGPAVSIVLLANILNLEDQLPEALHLPQLGGRVLALLAVLLLVFLIVLGAEVMILGPDLRTDGMHGMLAPEVLGLGAHPVLLHDLDGNHEPLGALYLGGNADLYVLYDPCAEIVRMVPVGSSRVELIEQVDCQSP